MSDNARAGQAPTRTDTDERLGGRWDFKKPRSILSDYDLDCIAYSISSAMHYCTNTQQCHPSGPLCAMCGNAMRLVVQAAEPRIIDRVLEKAARAVGREHVDLHPRCGDD